MTYEKICGKCAMENGLTLDERIEIALSRVPKRVYYCPYCREEHAFNAVAETTPMNIDALSLKSEDQPKKERKTRKELSETEQLSLF